MPKLDENIKLDIVGRGKIKNELIDLTKKMGVSKRVKFYENLSRKQLLKKFSDASVFVLPSSYEAYSLSVAEALMSGTPCIVANTSALVEWVDDLNCYGVKHPIVSDELLERVNYVLAENVEVNISKLIGKKILDWNIVVEQLEEIYLG
jgi:glycosyltransferase involved in cell wall biosynthesis